MLTRNKKQAQPTSGSDRLPIPTLPDWHEDKTVLAISAKIGELETRLADLRETLPRLQAHEAELQRGLSQGSVLRSMGVADADPAADARDQQLSAEIQATVRQQVQTRAALEQTEREAEAAKAMRPKIETDVRKRVMQAQRDIYMQQVERFTASIEQASREQEVLYMLHASIRQQFPAAFEMIDGEGVLTALGLPMPLFTEIRPPQAVLASPWASTLHRWRQSIASYQGVSNPYPLDDSGE